MRIAFFSLLILAACSTTTPTTFSARAPWDAPALTRGDVPAVYVTQWEKAENRATCALIAPRSVGPEGAGATARAATFSGGWAVAYDLPSLRSAFGVAGTGASQAGDAYDQWPHAHTWRDGSSDADVRYVLWILEHVEKGYRVVAGAEGDEMRFCVTLLHSSTSEE